MKYILGIGLIFLIQSCGSGVMQYHINEYVDFPKGLNYKEFQIEVVKRNQKIELDKDSLVQLFDYKKYDIFFNSIYFQKVYIKKKDITIVESLVKELKNIPNVGMVLWEAKHSKTFGAYKIAYPFFWHYYKLKNKENVPRVERIMDELSGYLNIKYGPYWWFEHQEYKFWNNYYKRKKQ